MTIRPLTGYIGGKWYLRRVICPQIDATPHACYVEPFMGMANIFLGRAIPRRVEVLNDTNGDVTTLFRVVRRHHAALTEELRFTMASRREYRRLLDARPSALTDIERAARFLFLRRLTFSGKDPYPGGFSASRVTRKGFDAIEIADRIVALSSRLAKVVIEDLDFADCLKLYDGPDTLFYLDPPYWDRSGLYRDGTFRQIDFDRLAEALRGVVGTWLLSLNDTPEVRSLFSWARIEEVETRYSAQAGPGKRVTELLIRQHQGSRCP